MSDQAQVRAAQTVPAADCPHYWLIDTPAGETSQGRCKLCGATRTFLNSTQRVGMIRSARSSPAAQDAS